MTTALYFEPIIESANRMYYVSTSNERFLAGCDTKEEAETARLAFERVMLPRFTADEAIEIVKAAIEAGTTNPEEYASGARVALEALAAAGAFVPDGAMTVCPECGGEGEISCTKPFAEHILEGCDRCGSSGRVPQTMADKLDKAGIR